MSKGKIALISIIAILCIATRILPVFLVPEEVKKVMSDSLEYNELAMNLLTGKGYSYTSDTMPFKGATAYRTPGYPLFLAGIYKVFGIENHMAARIIQAVLGSCVPFLLYLIAGLFFNRRTAVTALIIGILYKPFIALNFYGGPAFLLSENLVIVTFLAFIYLFLLAMKRSSLFLVSIAGILLAISGLIRPAFMLFPAFAVIVMLFNLRSIHRPPRFIMAFILSFLIMISPWLLRNYTVFGKVIFSTQSGSVLYAGNNPDAKGGWGRDAITRMERKTEGMDEVRANEFLSAAALAHIKENTGSYPKLVLKKLMVAFMPFYSGYEYNFCYAIIFPLFILSIFRMKRGNTFYWVMLASLLSFVLMSSIFFGDPRFRYPFETIFLIGAAHTVTNIFDSRFKRPLVILFSLYILGNIFIYFNWSRFV